MQIAKSFGADVTAVCSTRNVEMARSIGADRVIDYTQTDFTKGADRYDVIFGGVGNHSLSSYRRVLEPEGICVIAGGKSLGGILAHAIAALVLSRLVSQKFLVLVAKAKKEGSGGDRRPDGRGKGHAGSRQVLHARRGSGRDVVSRRRTRSRKNRSVCRRVPRAGGRLLKTRVSGQLRDPAGFYLSAADLDADVRSSRCLRFLLQHAELLERSLENDRDDPGHAVTRAASE